MSSLTGLDLLATAVLILDQEARISYANPAAEDLLEASAKILTGQLLKEIFVNSNELQAICQQILQGGITEKRQELILERHGHGLLHVHCIVAATGDQHDSILIELRENVQQLRLDREGRLFDQSQANRELIRNLAHEIKNPLGGIRGAAQLLEMELPERDLKAFREYTQVIIRESERLQALVDRLLVSHRRPPMMEEVNIHEICERVRSLILAECPDGLAIKRDYDLSIPEFLGDKEQLIQVVLNVSKNAVVALSDRIITDDAQIVFKTRVARQITIARVRYRLALSLHIIDNGPGIPEELIERIFYPLVSGHENGNGLGLTLAQTYIQHHRGVIECNSWQGHTEFIIRIPIW